MGQHTRFLNIYIYISRAQMPLIKAHADEYMEARYLSEPSSASILCVYKVSKFFFNKFSTTLNLFFQRNEYVEMNNFNVVCHAPG